MNTYLLITSIVIFLCILLNRVSNRIGIPALLAFIVLGMLFGSDGIMKNVGENEGAKFWLSIINGLKNRGIQSASCRRTCL